MSSKFDSTEVKLNDFVNELFVFICLQLVMEEFDEYSVLGISGNVSIEKLHHH